MRRSLLTIGTVVALAWPLGCAQVRGFFEETPEGERKAERERERERRARAVEFLPADSCPAQLDDIAVLAVDLKDAVALQFTAADEDDVAELRARVRNLLDHRRETTRATTGAELDPIPAEDVRYEEMRNGARLVFITSDERDLPALREQVAARADWLRTNDQCPRETLSLLAPGAGRAG